DKACTATGMQVDAMEDGYTDDALFSLASIKRDLQVVDSPAQSDDDDTIMSEGEAVETNQGVHSESEASDIDSDEERKRYDEQLETFLDQAYDWLQDDATDDQNGVDEENDSDDNDKDGEANPLMVPLSFKEQASQEQLTSQWFSQDIFAGFENTGEKYDTDSAMSEDGKDAASFQKLSAEINVKSSKSKKENIDVQSKSNLCGERRTPSRERG
ncbi:hypothetical protein KI387_021433, partial [Taxus chinensis]